MAEQFQEQGGVATMDPSPPLRWLTSRIVKRVCGDAGVSKRRARVERARHKSAQAHVVEYFHHVEDGYSHLAAQVLQAFAKRYDIELVCHLVQGPQGDNSAEPELLLGLSRYDSFHVAEDYGLSFPQCENAPDQALLKLASAILAGLDSPQFIEYAAQVGDAFWSGDEARLQALSESLGCANDVELEERLNAGTARRSELKHYSGAMFYYGQEWYWGVDRLYHLEKRLADLGADREQGQPMLMPRPAVEPGELKDNGSLTLEMYPSLRSPYTAVAFDRAVNLAAETGVKLVVRPVLPMVMRGVPATREKGMYIFSDAVREAREAGVPYGNFYDPIGEPVRRCYSLYPWACEQGRGVELLSAFLSAAFARGINTNNNRGLKTVVQAAGLDLKEAEQRIGAPGWEDLLEDNRLAMYEAGLWGVPSFRLLDEHGNSILSLWGQDRLWLFAREIQRQLAARQ
ncbi:MAG: 2-hydroxychromene-2-carboxylate isomerase [Halieaceae bacterium]|jgi:2-hydroxychromene-2-carboxylate isomerase